MFLITKILLSSYLFLSMAQAFTLNNSATLVFGQDEVKINIAANSCSNIGINENELLSIAGDAVNQYWNKSPTSRLKLRAGSVKSVIAAYKTGTICVTNTACDPNPTLAVDSDILITCNTNTTNFTNSSILAVTVPNNINGKTIIGSLIMINDQSGNRFASMSRDEKISVIAHELGHTFGLGHSPVKDSLMYYSTVDMRKSLGRDDIDGITYLYPKQQPVSCGTITEKNNPNSWLGLLLGFAFITLISKFQLRYLKLRARF
ncbi:MAG: matrixin family metalloprotease [Bacteriovorax sp.]|nr:matrixin family metalloprotease [Bacteriovorax sp.]